MESGPNKQTKKAKIMVALFFCEPVRILYIVGLQELFLESN